VDAQTWAALVAAIAAAGGTLIALGALAYSRRAGSAADRAARAAEEQTKIQQQLRIESAQPYVWVDIRADEAVGTLLNLVLGNSGPTVARNVHVQVAPPLPTIAQLRDRVEAAQARLADGISSLPPGRVITWPLGQGFNLLAADGPQIHTFTVKADGPFGPVPPLTYKLNLSDLRGTLDRPAGSLHQLTKAVEHVSRKLDSRLPLHDEQHPPAAPAS
jgi:hypothetical protein